MSSPKSTTLFHFTKSLDALKSILLQGFYPYYCLEDMSWQKKPSDSFIAFPLVCFCDIPIARISDHVRFYGSYGLGMSKDWGLNKGLNPVLYISKASPLVVSIRDAFKGAIKLRKDLGEENYLVSVRHIGAHTKLITGRMLVQGKQVEKDFYLENEWRYIPQVSGLTPYLKKDQFDDLATLQTWNDKAEIKGKLAFSPDDVRYIFVPKDADIPSLVNFIDQKLDFHPSSSLKLLMTRITSLEHIERDM